LNPVAIIGGGITGLCAAFALKSKGVPVTVYEASSRPGGVIQSVRKDGFLAEFGPNTLLETSPAISQLVQDAGLESEKLYTSPAATKRFLVRSGRPIEVPSSPLGLALTPLFSLNAKLAILREPTIPRRTDGSEESVADFVTRRLGREILDYAVDPMVGGIYAGDPEELSVHHAFPKLANLEAKYGSLIKAQILGARERKKSREISKDKAPKFSFNEGLERLPAALAKRLKSSIKLNTRTLGANYQNETWSLQCEGVSAARNEHSAIIFAGTGFQLPQFSLAHGDKAITLDLFSEIIYPPVASVVLGFRRSEVSHPCEGFGMLIPKAENFNILGTIFSSSLFPNRAPADCVLLTSYLGGRRQSDLALQSESKLLEMTRADLKTLLGATGTPVFQHIAVYPRAIPQYNLGYGKFLDAMTNIETNAPGFFFAGHYRDGVSLSDSILSGLRAAGNVQSFLSKHST
jgi:oxygen-dependent protoporphyrinogen oxidase